MYYPGNNVLVIELKIYAIEGGGQRGFLLVQRAFLRFTGDVERHE